MVVRVDRDLRRVRVDVLGLRGVRSQVPVELSTIALHALEKRPADRYPDMAALRDDLRRFLADEPIRARPDGPLRRSWKWSRRHRVAASLIGVSLPYALVTSVLLAMALQGRTALANEAQLGRLRLLELEAHALWPTSPEQIERLEDWLARLDRERADPPREEAARELLATLCAPEEGLADGLSAEHGFGVRTRLAQAREAERRLEPRHPDARAWSELSRALEGDEAFWNGPPRLLLPSPSLVPLGPDPKSGLDEFADLRTGLVPRRDPGTGALEVTEETGLVFVLLPGGTFLMGAEPERESRRYDPEAHEDERPVHAVSLAPFFLSKYEMTQGQWLRCTGENPSRFHPGVKPDVQPLDLRHPVEHVSWNRAREILVRLGMDLPTESQWEYAARAGTAWRWPTGPEPSTLMYEANLRDASYARVMNYPAMVDWDDGFVHHAPVDTYSPNGFGLYNVAGNVLEWCRDQQSSYSDPAIGPDAQRPALSTMVAYRGGCFIWGERLCRVSDRNFKFPAFRDRDIGIRPVLSVRSRQGLPAGAQ